MRLLGIAFRNLLRARRRNALAGGTMALGTAALILGSGLSDGIARQLTDNLVAVQTGEMMVVRREEGFVRQNSPFDAYSRERIENGAVVIREIEKRAGDLGIQQVAPYLHARGTAIASNRSTPAVVLGIVPDREPELFKALPPVAGSVLAGQPEEVYVGAPVARILRLSVGDSVSLLIQTPEGAMNSLDAVVCGIFRKGAPWYDNTFFVPLEAARKLEDSPEGVTNIKIRASGSRTALEQTRTSLSALVSGLSPAATVESAEEAGRFSFSIIQANEASLTILSVFLFAAAAVGIVNAMLMSVHERTREIGTVRAMGMRRMGVVRLFLLEGLALGVVAAVLGVIAGGAMVLYWASVGIRMNTVTLAWLAGGDFLYPRLEALSVLRAALAIIALSTVAAIYPAYAASRLEPREALHRV
ncbi:MAG: ABC transporter permease [Vicinamibacteria bacterium]|nr:ABC transporter permease [Vicinamibacteria bacterium]